MGDQGFGISPEVLKYVAEEVRSIFDLGVEIAIVVGGGNIFRGIAASSYNMDRVSADKMGMLATVINSLALQDALEERGIVTRVQTAISMHEVAEPYILRRAIRHLEKGRVVLFAAGTGNPYFSTDSAAALRAAELGMDVLLKGTRVSGVYSADPEKNPKAKLYPRLTYQQALVEHLAVMDLTAFALCMERKIPIVVFDITRPRAILDIMKGKRIGSLVC